MNARNPDITQRVAVVGLGMSPSDLTLHHLHVIELADLLIGGRRHLGYFAHHPGEKIVLSKNFKEVTALIRERMDSSRIVVLASGDPLYYGIGSLLIRDLGRQNVRVYPNISAIAAAFALIGESWQDAAVVSLHGREKLAELVDQLRCQSKIAVYTDPDHTPGWLAQTLLDRHPNECEAFKVCVISQIEGPFDAMPLPVFSRLDAIKDRVYAEPNVVIFMRDDQSSSRVGYSSVAIGLPDENYRHEKGLITHPEIRAITLAKLRLAPGQILWDLGAGSGSVGIEAARLLAPGHVYAIEQHLSRIAHIEDNIRTHGIVNLTVSQAQLPQGLERLPQPDRVFIGGAGKHLVEIVEKTAEYLEPGGVLMMNTVLMANLDAPVTCLEDMNFNVEVIQVQVNKGVSMPYSRRFEAGNPVWMITGVKKK